MTMLLLYSGLATRQPCTVCKFQRLVATEHLPRTLHGIPTVGEPLEK